MTWDRQTGTATTQGYATVKATQGRLSRRQFLYTAGTVAGAAGVGLWPGASAGQTPTVIKATPELVVAFSLDPGHLDPRAEAGEETAAEEGSGLPKVAETHLWTLCRSWGATERGGGHAERATSALVLESDMANTGDVWGEVKASG